MCGITGKIYLDPARHAEVNELKRMTDVIIHRGPDDEGFFTRGNVGLGFRRLSIIDLNTGHQPLSNESGTVVIIFNGEIYNYREKKEELLKKGYVFRTTTDTEVILHLYEEYGTGCLQHLRGMFGFAIWDENKKQLFCARDRFGIKPFYYYLDDEKLLFGSEIKSIMAADSIDRSLSQDALDSYFAFGYISGDLSVYNKVRKLLPGHYLMLSFNNGASVNIKRYYGLVFEPDHSKTEEQWAEELEACLSDTVKRHMISDVPLGAFLSGGIDSSSVVAMMAKNSPYPVKTFTIGFRGQKDNENVYAREVAERYGCEYHEQIIDPDSIELLPLLVKGYDEPFSDPSAIPTYYVSKFARENVTVALSGDGGDELFSGYDVFRYLHNIYRFSSPWPALNKTVWGSLNRMIPQHIAGKGLTYFLSKDRRYLGAYLCYWTKEERDRLLLHDRKKIDLSRGSELYKKSILERGSGNDFISNLQNVTMQTYMIDDVLTKVDRASMLNSLEVRVPLLDHVFVELTLKIPWYLKLKGKEQKYIFKQAMNSYLPHSILKHQKQGFNIPLLKWFRGDLRQYVNDTLMSRTPYLADFLDLKYARTVVRNNEKGMRDLGFRVWSLLLFEEWLKQNHES